MKGRLRQGVYPMGMRMSLGVSLYQALGIHTYVYLRAATVSAEIFGHIILHYDCVFCACMHVFVSVVLWPISSTVDGWSISVAYLISMLVLSSVSTLSATLITDSL